MEIPERVYQRVIHWADRDPETGCLVSRYSVGSHGYAQVGWTDGRRTMTLCHLVVWRWVEGDVPEGMTVDHTCKNTKCVEREHLRLLTNFDNARRTGGRDWPLGQCINGHSDEFLRTAPNGRTRCSKCKEDYRRAWRARKKAEKNR